MDQFTSASSSSAAAPRRNTNFEPLTVAPCGVDTVEDQIACACTGVACVLKGEL